MTRNAIDACMRPRQRECRRRMVKAAWRPSAGRVTGRAVMIKIVVDVTRINCGGKVPLMT